MESGVGAGIPVSWKEGRRFRLVRVGHSEELPPPEPQVASRVNTLKVGKAGDRIIEVVGLHSLEEEHHPKEGRQYYFFHCDGFIQRIEGRMDGEGLQFLSVWADNGLQAKFGVETVGEAFAVPLEEDEWPFAIYCRGEGCVRELGCFVAR